MKVSRLGWFALSLTIVLTVAAIGFQHTSFLVHNKDTISLLGTLYTIIALVFSILAALWARDARNIVSAYFKDFFALSEPERQLFVRLAVATRGGKDCATQEQFDSMTKDFRDAAWYLNSLIEKQWIERLSAGIAIRESKKIIAQELQPGETNHV